MDAPILPQKAHVTPTSTMELPYSKRASDSKEPQCQEPQVDTRENDDAIDHISSMADDVLRKIISLLPTKDGARTQILATRWRPLWRSAPLNLDHRELAADGQAQIDTILKILADHQGPGRRLSLPNLHLEHYPCPPVIVNAWLRSDALNNLQELELGNGNFLREHVLPPPLPISAFRFSATLRAATISQCHLRRQPVQMNIFPELRHLALNYVRISDVFLHSLIAHCPVLECLQLNRSTGFDCLRIKSPSLRSIGISCVELIIEDAPLLERLLQFDPHNGLPVSVISAPKLETLGCFSELGGPRSTLAFSTTVIKSIASSRNTNSWRRKKHILMRNLEIRLKTVVMKCYKGTKSQVNFATFFVLNAKMLEEMRFEGEKYDDEMLIAEHLKLLQVEKRASRSAQFSFTTGRECRHKHNLLHIKHVRDLSLVDPFECTCST
ncbi:hypothetical protein PR202_gb17315 [Eleusine coracana subsp. coracana]|uniref:FBD domain-containing protein n=1 Tax=Eleusine coracana subsp. coracana TaxID=191504 RepID=A0AAV5F3A6_ELECO|nr:hypothetical protein PR202_gb17315 [Eleusine coracana subsp. coracana]